MTARCKTPKEFVQYARDTMQTNDVFHTPTSKKEFEDWLNLQASGGGCQPTVVAMVTLNYLFNALANKLPEPEWVSVDDEYVKHEWRHPTTGEVVHVSPDFYEQNGTPMDGLTDEMYKYVRTIICKDGIK